MRERCPTRASPIATLKASSSRRSCLEKVRYRVAPHAENSIGRCGSIFPGLFGCSDNSVLVANLRGIAAKFIAED